MKFRNYPFALTRLRFWYRFDLEVAPYAWPALIAIAAYLLAAGGIVRIVP